MDQEIAKHINLLQSDMLDRTEVQVSIKLAEISMSVAEVLDLLPGQLVHLPIKIDQGVTLMIGDEVVASAKIVKNEAIEGQATTSRSKYYLQIEDV